MYEPNSDWEYVAREEAIEDQHRRWDRDKLERQHRTARLQGNLFDQETGCTPEEIEGGQG